VALSAEGGVALDACFLAGALVVFAAILAAAPSYYIVAVLEAEAASVATVASLEALTHGLSALAIVFACLNHF